jgi:hypothetical protein
MMVDWVSGFIEATLGRVGYDTGKVLRLAPGGEVTLETSNAVTVEGSHESRLLVRSRSGDDLFISGNPAKFVQGHNLFGPADPDLLYFHAGLAIRQSCGLFPSEATWDGLGFKGPRYTRIDLTRSYRFESAGNARAWLRDVAANARTRHGGALVTGATVYFGKNSERWSFKCYHKFDELHARKKGHALPHYLEDRKKLVEWSQGVVRFELTLRSKELEKLNLRTTPPLAVWQTYFDRITLNRNTAMRDEDDLLATELPASARAALELWRRGVDCREVFPHNSFYRHRRALLATLGVDIASPPPAQPSAPNSEQLLDPKGWDPEPLDGYGWETADRPYWEKG